MGKTVKARFSKGVIKPLEKVEIEEGKEITITIMEAPSKQKLDAFKKSAGAWKGTIDAEKLIENKKVGSGLRYLEIFVKM